MNFNSWNHVFQVWRWCSAFRLNMRLWKWLQFLYPWQLVSHISASLCFDNWIWVAEGHREPPEATAACQDWPWCGYSPIILYFSLWSEIWAFATVLLEPRDRRPVRAQGRLVSPHPAEVTKHTQLQHVGLCCKSILQCAAPLLYDDRVPTYQQLCMHEIHWKHNHYCQYIWFLIIHSILGVFLPRFCFFTLVLNAALAWSS